MADRIRPRVDQVRRLGLAKYYVCHFPIDNVSEEYYDSNVKEFERTSETFTKALKSAVEVGISSFVDAATSKKKIDDVEKEGKTSGVTPTPPPLPLNIGQTCPPPVVSTFSPSAGFTGTIVQVNGRNFESVKSITVAGQNVDINNITVFNSETLRFILPAVPIPDGQKVAIGKIIVTTDFGTFESLVNFTFNPVLQNFSASSAGGFANPTIQEQSSVEQQDIIGSDLNPQNIGSTTFIEKSVSLNKFGDGITNSLQVSLNPNSPSATLSEEVLMNLSIYDLDLSNNQVKRISPCRTERISINGYVKDNVFFITYEDVADMIITNPIGPLGKNPIKNTQLVEIQFNLIAYPTDSVKFPKPVERNSNFKFR